MNDDRSFDDARTNRGVLGTAQDINVHALFVADGQTLLAKEGDQEELERIIEELNHASYMDAIGKLQYIGSTQAFEALLRSLSLQTFMPHVARDTNQAYLNAEGHKLRAAVMAALSQTVSNPPLSPTSPATEANIKTWNSWWEANKNQGVVRTVPF